MNNRQKRLCRALLDYYDASGAQPYPLAQLAKKTGYDASDIYDKDSQSGDLWPFDAKARGNLAGMLAFTSGKSPTVNLTSAGLVGLEKLLGDEPAAPVPAKANVSAKPFPTPAAEAPPPPKMVAPAAKHAAVSAKPFPAHSAKPFPAHSAKPFAAKPATAPATKPTPVATKHFTTEGIAEARTRFNYWLKSHPAGQKLIDGNEGHELVEAAFDKFFSEFLEGKNS